MCSCSRVPGAAPPKALLKLVTRWFGAIQSLIPIDPPPTSRGPAVVLVLDDVDTYIRYLRGYYPGVSRGDSLGCCVRTGYIHTVVSRERHGHLEYTLVHELVHAWCTDLRLPLWLEEGLCQYIPQLVLNSYTFQVSRELMARHKHFWTNQGLERFWRGLDFGRRGAVQELSYHLAELLVRQVMTDYPKVFRRFVLAARSVDGGEAAAREHLGQSLGALAAKPLGPGDWDWRHTEVVGDS